MSYGIQILDSSGETVFDSRDSHLAVHDYGTAVLNVKAYQPETFNVLFSKPISKKPHVFLEERPWSYADTRIEWERPFPTLPEIPVPYSIMFRYRYLGLIQSGSQYTGFRVQFYDATGWMRYVNLVPGWHGSDPPWRIRWVALYEI